MQVDGVGEGPEALLLLHRHECAARAAGSARQATRTFTPEKFRPTRAKFFGMLANLDDNVGRLLAQLKEWDLERDTLVVFMNDNGGTVGLPDLERRHARTERLRLGKAAPAPLPSGAGPAR